jgi:hypothetical protein
VVLVLVSEKSFSKKGEKNGKLNKLPSRMQDLLEEPLACYGILRSTSFRCRRHRNNLERNRSRYRSSYSQVNCKKAL